MSMLITWEPSLSVGVESIDKQHRRLVDMVNDLHTSMLAGHGQDALGKILSGLVAYTHEHFRHEEQLMRTHGYPTSDVHFKQHRELEKTVQEFGTRFAEGKERISIELSRFLKDWLTHHIMRTDKELGKFLQAAAA